MLDRFIKPTQPILTQQSIAGPPDLSKKNKFFRVLSVASKTVNWVNTSK